jgi:23S rRNA pseudouridine1911/1915/1917 synthase
MRLDSYLAQYWPEFSRSQWQKYTLAGYVQINGVVETSNKRALGEDDEVTTHVPDRTDYSAEELPIIFENDDVIVINKPTGILTHAKGAVADEFTVADFVRGHMNEVDDTNRPGIVHRLDRGTSGIIIAAKNAEAKRHLQKQFQDRKAKKEYLAVVIGHPKHEAARIELPIERNPKAPSSFRVGASGKTAITEYQVIASDAKRSVVSLRPTTGRTHQLRVHMQSLGSPILGDSLYGGGNSPIDRLCLHAHSLEITIPGGERRTFTAEPPADLAALIDEIKRD